MRKIDNMNDTTDVNEEKRESPFYSFFDADLVFDIISLSPTTHNYRNIDKNKQKWYNRSAREKAEKSKKTCT